MKPFNILILDSSGPRHDALGAAAATANANPNRKRTLHVTHAYNIGRFAAALADDKLYDAVIFARDLGYPAGHRYSGTTAAAMLGGVIGAYQSPYRKDNMPALIAWDPNIRASTEIKDTLELLFEHIPIMCEVHIFSPQFCEGLCARWSRVSDAQG